MSEAEIKILGLFPHQLFSPKHLRTACAPAEIVQIVLIDHNYFRAPPHVKVPLNPLRIRYIDETLAAYQKELTAAGFRVHRQTNIPHDAAFIDPCDKYIEAKLPKNARIYDSPSWILTKREVAEFPFKARMQHAPFYAYMKKKLGILADVPNQDEQNRRPFPRDAVLPKEPGPFAVSRTGARAWLAQFFRERFAQFGPYEDAVVPASPFLYHSGISVYLNNGLLTPMEVVRGAWKLRDKVPLSSLEGFLRQVIGWREYCRAYYLRAPPIVVGIKKAGAGPMPNAWLTGKTGIPIVDQTIQKAWSLGYLHHIERLMIMSNYFQLFGAHPRNVYDWFYAFSLDAYDWVMVFNVYSMGLHADGGYAMRKPYASSTNYLRKMVRDLERGAWESHWDAAYAEFKDKQAKGHISATLFPR